MIYVNNHPVIPDKCFYCGRELKVMTVDRTTTVAQLCCGFCGGRL